MGNESPAAFREAFNLLCGDQIGCGIGRQVYSSEILPDCVVKVETRSGSFQNVIEWESWQHVRETDLAQWFAPCRWISPSGTVLVMERTQPLPKEDYPDKIPAFLTDMKYSNYGSLFGRVVCHDYGTNLLMTVGITRRMRKAEWWE